MKRFLPFALSLSLAFPTFAQQAPAGWTTQTKAGGAKTFTPPDLKTGEIYSVTIYDAAPLGGRSLEVFLRDFAGTVGNKAGQLTAPLEIETKPTGVVVGIGAYNAPKGATLGVLFLARVRQNKTVSVSRTLFSQEQLYVRYQSANLAFASAMKMRGEPETGKMSEVGGQTPVAAGQLKLGGDIVPGVYVGERRGDGELWNSFRVYIYANGEYRVTDRNDLDYKEGNRVLSVGKFSYNRKNGGLELDRHFDLNNDSIHPETDFCLYGRNSDGKPAIYAERSSGSRTVRTSLVYAGPPTKRLSPSAERALEEAKELEVARFKFVVAPGRGVQIAQIAGVFHHADYSDRDRGEVRETVWLLLRDGTAYRGLPVAPDQFDAPTSRRKEPKNWGRWRLQNGKTQVAWAGGSFQNIVGKRVTPATPGTRLSGRFGTARALLSLTGSGWNEAWGVTFDRAGRFKKDDSGSSVTSVGNTTVATGHDESGSVTSAQSGSVIVGATRQNVPYGNRQGTYSLNGYTLTLRYDNGAVTRLPFFFINPNRTSLWFEGALLSLDGSDN